MEQYPIQSLKTQVRHNVFTSCILIKSSRANLMMEEEGRQLLVHFCCKKKVREVSHTIINCSFSYCKISAKC